MRALVLVLALATPASAYPVFVAEDPVPEPPLTKLGFRLGGGRVPLADTALGTGQVAIGIEHVLCGKLRILGEYEWLSVTEVPEEPEMTTSFTGMGHRTNLGLRRVFAEKSMDVVRFYADIELGGGLGLYDAPSGAAVMPHGFIGLRGGYQLVNRRAKASRTLETEVQLRAIVVEHGIGFGVGLGFWWGD